MNRNQEIAKELLIITANLFNKFLELEDVHPNDNAEMARDIHDIQNRILANTVDKDTLGLK